MNKTIHILKVLGGSFKRLIIFSIKISPIVALKLFINDWEKYLSISKKTKYNAYEKQHIIIENYLKNKGYSELIKEELERAKNKNISNSQKPPIWICWWQGEEHMPPLVTSCYNRIKKYSNDHPVYLITLENVNEYITIPPSILEKFYTGKIKHAHLADLTRLKLIAKFGGIWIDSTVFLTAPINENLFYKPFVTIKNQPYDNKSVSKFRWCSFFIGGLPHNPYISAIEKALENYMIKENIFLHYLIIDYFIDIMYKTNNDFKKIVDDLPITNPNMHWIQLNQQFSFKEFEIINKNTTIYKTTYKGQLKTITNQGKTTYYGYIINSSKQI